MDVSVISNSIFNIFPHSYICPIEGNYDFCIFSLLFKILLIKFIIYYKITYIVTCNVKSIHHNLDLIATNYLPKTSILVNVQVRGMLSAILCNPCQYPNESQLYNIHATNEDVPR
jgi:hypothetical protein